MKTGNEYFRELPSRVPKSVYAALAYSLALRLTEDNPAKAKDLLCREWATLHENQIVPQSPIGRALWTLDPREVKS